MPDPVSLLLPLLQAIAAIKKNQEQLEAKVQLKKEAEARRAEQAKKSSEIARSKQEDEGTRRSDIKCVHCKDKA